MASKKHFAGIDFRNSKIAINGNTTSSRYLGTDSNGDLEWKTGTSGAVDGAFRRQATGTVSSGAIEISGFYSGTHCGYKIIGTGLYASTNLFSSGSGGDPQFLKLTIGTSSTYLTGSSYDDYKWHMIMQYPNYVSSSLFTDDHNAADGTVLREFRNHNMVTGHNQFWRIANLHNDEYQSMSFEMNLFGLDHFETAAFADSIATCRFTCKSTNRDAWFESGDASGTVSDTPSFSEVTTAGIFSTDDNDRTINKLKFEAGSGTLSGGKISVFKLMHTN